MGCTKVAEAIAGRLSAPPAQLTDCDGVVVDAFAADLGRVCGDLQGCTALMAVRDGVLMVEGLEPVRHPSFLAMPNHAIEEVAGLTLRMVQAESRAGGFTCRDGRTLRTQGVLVCPDADAFTVDASLIRSPVARRKDLVLAGVASFTSLGAAFLIAVDLVDPIVMVAVPAPLFYGWALHRRAVWSARMERILPLLNEHAGRLAVQAKSIAAAANRARGLGATTT